MHLEGADLILQLGEGSIKPVLPIPADLRGYKFVYALHPTNTTAQTLGQDLMQRVFTDSGMISAGARIQQVQTLRGIDNACRSNFNGLSDCWLGVQVYDVDPANQKLVGSSFSMPLGWNRTVTSAESVLTSCRITP